MKKVLTSLLLILLASCFAFGQGQGKSDREQTARVEQTLRTIEQECSDASVKGDTSVIERYYVDTCALTDPDGEVGNRAALVADLKSGELKFEASTLDKMKVQVYGNAAIVTVRATEKGAYRGHDLSGKYQWTDTFVKVGGRWQIVADHTTRVSVQ